jgi:transposase
MLDQSQRQTIVELRRRGVAIRAIARTMKVSRKVVRTVLRARSPTVPTLTRPEKAEPHREQILELHRRCKGNLVRVHEELVELGVAISYPALTSFCRRHGVGHEPKVAAGHYHFDPGEEMQHDTSPHKLTLDGVLRPVQTASLVLCYSRMLFFQFSPTFRRFDCKLFLDEAFRYMQGTCKRCVIDNTHVVVLRGTGREMVPVPEMALFAERYDFEFCAHERGDANRSGRVERPFDYIERNFLAGREFRDWDDANAQARAWCDKVNASYRKRLKASPRELYVSERVHLRQLPVWVPPVYLLHQRIVDVEGYVSVNTNRYSVPETWIGRRLEVREGKTDVEIYDGPRLLARHPRVLEPCGQRTTSPEHRRPRGEGRKRTDPSFEEKSLLTRAPEFADYIATLKQRATGRGTLALRRLLRLVDDYPREPLRAAVTTALHYGLYDVERLERMVLRNVAKEALEDYFELDTERKAEDDDDA